MTIEITNNTWFFSIYSLDVVINLIMVIVVRYQLCCVGIIVVVAIIYL